MVYFKEVLLLKNVTQDTKNFYASNNLFQTVLTKFALVLCIYDSLCLKTIKFNTWLTKNNWPKLVEYIEDKYLDLFKII